MSFSNASFSSKTVYPSSVRIGLMDPYIAQTWAQRIVSDGRTIASIKKGDTINHTTSQPIATGLFCQRIFGPCIDYTCACGHEKIRIHVNVNVSPPICPECHVEWTESSVRRQRLGSIELISPVTHKWFSDSRNYIPILAGITVKTFKSLKDCKLFFPFSLQHLETRTLQLETVSKPNTQFIVNSNGLKTQQPKRAMEVLQSLLRFKPVHNSIKSEINTFEGGTTKLQDFGPKLPIFESAGSLPDTNALTLQNNTLLLKTNKESSGEKNSGFNQNKNFLNFTRTGKSRFTKRNSKFLPFNLTIASLLKIEKKQDQNFYFAIATRKSLKKKMSIGLSSFRLKKKNLTSNTLKFQEISSRNFSRSGFLHQGFVPILPFGAWGYGPYQGPKPSYAPLAPLVHAPQEGRAPKVQGGHKVQEGATSSTIQNSTNFNNINGKLKKNLEIIKKHKQKVKFIKLAAQSKKFKDFKYSKEPAKELKDLRGSKCHKFFGSEFQCFNINNCFPVRPSFTQPEDYRRQFIKFVGNDGYIRSHDVPVYRYTNQRIAGPRHFQSNLSQQNDLFTSNRSFANDPFSHSNPYLYPSGIGGLDINIGYLQENLDQNSCDVLTLNHKPLDIKVHKVQDLFQKGLDQRSTGLRTQPKSPNLALKVVNPKIRAFSRICGYGPYQGPKPSYGPIGPKPPALDLAPSVLDLDKVLPPRGHNKVHKVPGGFGPIGPQLGGGPEAQTQAQGHLHGLESLTSNTLGLIKKQAKDIWAYSETFKKTPSIRKSVKKKNTESFNWTTFANKLQNQPPLEVYFSETKSQAKEQTVKTILSQTGGGGLQSYLGLLNLGQLIMILQNDLFEIAPRYAKSQSTRGILLQIVNETFTQLNQTSHLLKQVQTKKPQRFKHPKSKNLDLGLKFTTYREVPQSPKPLVDKQDQKPLTKVFEPLDSPSKKHEPVFLELKTSETELKGSSSEKNLLNFTNQQLTLSKIASLSLKIESLEKKYKDVKKEYKVVKKICSDFQNRKNLTKRRYKLAFQLLRTMSNPAGMTLSCVPVLPPGLRPIIDVPKIGPITADLNIRYRGLIFALRNLRELAYVDFRNAGAAQASVQEAVDDLLYTGGKTRSSSSSIGFSGPNLYKSLAMRLKGKHGRFRGNLLGKRVDYSGRSVIVVGPTLKIHQCGLPFEIAIKLFNPFLIRRLIQKGLCKNVYKAKQILLEGKFKPLIWALCREVMLEHLVLLNRAPTLHRLGVQAFMPILISGRAILLHPLVCTGFNADFDGDQMGVHVPLFPQARAEAWKMMWSRNNFLSPSGGEPILLPSQDMVLGCYYLTESPFLYKTKATFNWCESPTAHAVQCSAVHEVVLCSAPSCAPRAPFEGLRPKVYAPCTLWTYRSKAEGALGARGAMARPTGPKTPAQVVDQRFNSKYKSSIFLRNKIVHLNNKDVSKKTKYYPFTFVKTNYSSVFTKGFIEEKLKLNSHKIETLVNRDIFDTFNINNKKISTKPSASFPPLGKGFWFLAYNFKFMRWNLLAESKVLRLSPVRGLGISYKQKLNPGFNFARIPSTTPCTYGAVQCSAPKVQEGARRCKKVQGGFGPIGPKLGTPQVRKNKTWDFGFDESFVLNYFTASIKEKYIRSEVFSVKSVLDQYRRGLYDIQSTVWVYMENQVVNKSQQPFRDSARGNKSKFILGPPLTRGEKKAPQEPYDSLPKLVSNHIKAKTSIEVFKLKEHVEKVLPTPKNLRAKLSKTLLQAPPSSFMKNGYITKIECDTSITPSLELRITPFGITQLLQTVASKRTVFDNSILVPLKEKLEPTFKVSSIRTTIGRLLFNDVLQKLDVF